MNLPAAELLSRQLVAALVGHRLHDSAIRLHGEVKREMNRKRNEPSRNSPKE